MGISRKLLSILLTIMLAAALLVPSSAFSSNAVSEETAAAEKSELVRVNVMVHQSSFNEVKKEIKKLGGKILDEWKFINTALVEIESNKISIIKALSGVISVSLEGTVEANGKTTSLDPKIVENTFPFAVSAETAWTKGMTGKGVTVAVIDSGIDTPARNDFGDRILTNIKTNSDAKYTADKYGHGTHVAGIIAGDGNVSGGKYVGIAPEANLINVKFSGDDGSAREQDLVSAMQWVYENKDKYNIRVANISSSIGAVQSYKESPTAAAAEMLWKSGIVVVASAGNVGGTDCSTCHAPGNDPFVITVGAVDDNNTKNLSDDYMKSWSSMGVTLDGHQKPEVVAPGSEAIAYMPAGMLKDMAPGNVVAEKYFKMGGTSMSAPVVSGLVALMLQAKPDLTPDQVKGILMATAADNSYYADSTLSIKAKDLYSYVPGLVRTKEAVFYSDTIQPANQGLELHPAISEALTEDMSFSNMSWSNMSWSNMSWSNMSWANSFDK